MTFIREIVIVSTICSKLNIVEIKPSYHHAFPGPRAAEQVHSGILRVGFKVGSGFKYLKSSSHDPVGNQDSNSSFGS